MGQWSLKVTAFRNSRSRGSRLGLAFTVLSFVLCWKNEEVVNTFIQVACFISKIRHLTCKIAQF